MPEHIRAMLPTLPKLVEVPEERRVFIDQRPVFVDPLVRGRTRFQPVFVEDDFVRTFVSEPLAPLPVLVQEPAPARTFVHTPEFHIESSPANTHVRIGQ